MNGEASVKIESVLIASRTRSLWISLSIHFELNDYSLLDALRLLKSEKREEEQREKKVIVFIYNQNAKTHTNMHLIMSKSRV